MGGVSDIVWRRSLMKTDLSVYSTSTYTFSPLSGLILSHVINSIQPAPHQAVYDSLRSSLGKVFGWEGGTPTGLPRPANVHPTPAACRADGRGHGDPSKKV
jgi:hypothetical protein